MRLFCWRHQRKGHGFDSKACKLQYVSWSHGSLAFIFGDTFMDQMRNPPLGLSVLDFIMALCRDLS